MQYTFWLFLWFKTLKLFEMCINIRILIHFSKIHTCITLLLFSTKLTSDKSQTSIFSGSMVLILNFYKISGNYRKLFINTLSDLIYSMNQTEQYKLYELHFSLIRDTQNEIHWRMLWKVWTWRQLTHSFSGDYNHRQDIK